LKLSSGYFKWTYFKTAVAGSGVNTQIGTILNGVDDYSELSSASFYTTVQQMFSPANSYGDTLGLCYEKNIKAWVQGLLDAGRDYACFSMQAADENVDVSNARSYTVLDEMLYFQVEEETTGKVALRADDGVAFGDVIGNYDKDTEEIDLKSLFTGTGKKRIKLSSPYLRRIDGLLRIGLTLGYD
jgi:hypothetical protein